MRVLMAFAAWMLGTGIAAAQVLPQPRPEAAPAANAPAPMALLSQADGFDLSGIARTPVPRPSGSVRPAEPYAVSGAQLAAASAAPVVLRHDVPANQLFGAVRAPAPLKARAIGSYARGCLAGAVPLPVNGAAWQVMRLSRNRNWGHPELVAFLERLAKAAPSLGWNGLLVGDMAQPRGGPMLTGHASHQIGLDADIWLRPMPNYQMSREEREKTAARSVLGGRYASAEIPEGGRIDKAVWSDAHARLIRQAAIDGDVARIFVHPAIKKALCDWASGDRTWLRKVRPWYGHHYHFHVRLRCPPDSAGCKDQAAPPPGDGCDKSLDWWLSDAPYEKRRQRRAAAAKNTTWKPMTIDGLPNACETVLVAK